MAQKEIIVKGFDMPFKLFEGSFPDFIFQKFKSWPQDRLYEIDYETGEELTFGELLKLSAEIGEGLIKDGLKPGNVVALAGKNSTQLHAAAYGIAFSGGIFAPVQSDMKVFEMQLLYQQLQPKYIFCEHNVENDVETCLKMMNSNAKIVIIDAPPNYRTKNLQFKDLLTKVNIDTYTPKPVQNPAEEVAMILCSSGSSGIPKGVQLTHRGIVYQLQCWEYYRVFDYTQTYLQTSHFFWISGVLFTLFTFLFGNKRIYIRDVNTKNILNAIEKYRPYWMFLPPPQILSLLNYPDFKKYDVSSLKYLYTGGAQLPQAVIDRVREFNDHVTLIQGYGMTEMSGAVQIIDLKADVKSVGLPIHGISLKVVDITTGKSLGPNQNGELLYKSIGLMKGYIANDEATKNAVDSDGWFHSGDLGYYTETNHIYLVDRVKEIIKYRSMQISPAEIETFLQSLPGVKEVGVVGIPNDEDMTHPMALIVKKEGYNITAEEIKDSVKNNLSEYKQLRAGVFFIDQLPRTSTGKVKRMAMKELGKKLFEGAKAGDQRYKK